MPEEKRKTIHVLKGFRGGGSTADWRNQVRLRENHDTLWPRRRGGCDRQRCGTCGWGLLQVRETMHPRQGGSRVQGAGGSDLLRTASPSLCALGSAVRGR